MVQWSETAYELVLFIMLEEFEKNDRTNVMDPKLAKTGMSFKPHKKFENIFQVVFLKQKSNVMA